MSTPIENDPEFHPASPKPGSGGRFKILNVLAALGIIAVLIAFLFPATRNARPAMRRTQCVNNLKQIGLALRNYELAYQALPPACTVDANGKPLHSWRTLILPYLENTLVYNTIDLTKPWNDPANAQALATPLNVYLCAEATGPRNTTCYLASPRCLIPKEPRRLAEIADDHAHTLLVIEVDDTKAVPWMAPVDADESFVMNFGANAKLHHAGGTNACFVDNSVQFLKASTPAGVRRALLSISGHDDDTLKGEW